MSILSSEILNLAASEWSHESLFPHFHVEESEGLYYERSAEATQNWKWKAFHSLVMGPCYTFEFTKNVTAVTTKGGDGAAAGAFDATLWIKYGLVWLGVG